MTMFVTVLKLLTYSRYSDLMLWYLSDNNIWVGPVLKILGHRLAVHLGRSRAKLQQKCGGNTGRGWDIEMWKCGDILYGEGYDADLKLKVFQCCWHRRWAYFCLVPFPYLVIAVVCFVLQNVVCFVLQKTVKNLTQCHLDLLNLSSAVQHLQHPSPSPGRQTPSSSSSS